jgi:SSS family solute:Na+ symporter
VVTIVGILLSVGAAYWAKQFPTIMDYIQAIFSWVNAPLFATILLGMFWKRITPNGAFWGLLLGMLSSFFMFVGIRAGWLDPKWLTFYENPTEMSHNLWRAWWAWLICLTVTVAVSLFTKPKSDDELQGLVRGLTPKPRLKGVPIVKRPAFWALVSLIVLIALNIYFW